MSKYFIFVLFILVTCFPATLLSVNPTFYSSEGGSQPIPEEEQTPPDCDECECTGSPCYPGSGNAYWTDTDLRLISRTGNLFIQRRYNSNDKSLGAFGWGWSFNYDVRLISAYQGTQHYFVLRLPNGRRVRLLPIGDGTGDYLPERAVDDLSSYKLQGKLAFSPNGAPCTTAPAFPGGHVEGPYRYCESKYYDYAAETIYTFGEFGQLKSMETSKGVITLTYYAGGLLAGVGDGTGLGVNIYWNASGLIEEISYQGATQLEHLYYTYDDYNNLVGFEDQVGRLTSFRYGEYYDGAGWYPYGYVSGGPDDYENPYVHKLASVRDHIGRQKIYFKYYYTYPYELGGNDPSNKNNLFIKNGKLQAYEEGGRTFTYTYDAIQGTASKTSDDCPTQGYSMQLSRKGTIKSVSFGGQWSVSSDYRMDGTLLKHCTRARDGLVTQNTYDLGAKGNLIESKTLLSDAACNNSYIGFGCYDGTIEGPQKCSPCNTCNSPPINEIQMAYIDRKWGTQLKYKKTKGMPGSWYDYEDDAPPAVPDSWGPLLGVYRIPINSPYVYDPTDPDPPADGELVSRLYYDDQNGQPNIYGRPTRACANREVNDILTEVCTRYDYDSTYSRALTVYRPPNNDVGQESITLYTYDALGRMLTSTDPVGSVTSYSYDALDRYMTVKLPNPASGAADGIFTTSISYEDSAHDCIDADGVVMHDCTMVTETDVNGLETKSYFDGEARLIEQKIEKSGMPTVRSAYAYSAYGVEKIVDANGNYLQYSYDSCTGSLASIMGHGLGGNGAPTTYTYDAATGRLENVVNAERGTTIVLTYDSLGRLFEGKYLNPVLCPASPYCYDIIFGFSGNRINDSLISVTEDGNTSHVWNAPRSTTYDYTDPWGRLKAVSMPEGDIYYAYKPGTDLIEQESHTVASDPMEDGDATYTYYLSGNIKSIVFDDGDQTATYKYDLRGLLLQKSLAGAMDNSLSSYTYDKQSRVKSITNRFNQESPKNISYEYDQGLLGMRTSMTMPGPYGDPIGTTQYGYDYLYRLTSVQYPNWPNWWKFSGQLHEFDYDLIGNRKWLKKNGIQYNYTYALNNVGNNSQRLLRGPYSDGRHYNYTWNAAGDLIRVYQDPPSSWSESMTYNATGTLYALTQGNDPSRNPVYTNNYDFSGKRYRMTYRRGPGSPTTIMNYLYSNEDVIALTTNVGGNRRIWHGAGFDDVLGWKEIGNIYYGEDVYFQSDALGSIIAQKGGTWGGMEPRYTAFGEATDYGDTDWTYAYAGREAFTGRYYYNRARYYEPGIGRFTQKDPLKLLRARNLFAYGSNNPIMHNDPSGLAPPGAVGCRTNATQGQDVFIVVNDPTPDAAGGNFSGDETILTWGPTPAECDKPMPTMIGSETDPYAMNYPIQSASVVYESGMSTEEVEAAYNEWLEDHPDSCYDTAPKYEKCSDFVADMVGRDRPKSGGVPAGQAGPAYFCSGYAKNTPPKPWWYIFIW